MKKENNNKIRKLKHKKRIINFYIKLKNLIRKWSSGNMI
jgi:hypothetical protein